LRDWWEGEGMEKCGVGYIWEYTEKYPWEEVEKRQTKFYVREQ
jgi:hypothetical protein